MSDNEPRVVTLFRLAPVSQAQTRRFVLIKYRSAGGEVSAIADARAVDGHIALARKHGYRIEDNRQTEIPGDFLPADDENVVLLDCGTRVYRKRRAGMVDPTDPDERARLQRAADRRNDRDRDKAPLLALMGGLRETTVDDLATALNRTLDAMTESDESFAAKAREWRDKARALLSPEQFEVAERRLADTWIPLDPAYDCDYWCREATRAAALASPTAEADA